MIYIDRKATMISNGFMIWEGIVSEFNSIIRQV